MLSFDFPKCCTNGALGREWKDPRDVDQVSASQKSMPLPLTLPVVKTGANAMGSLTSLGLSHGQVRKFMIAIFLFADVSNAGVL
jgi:hypothetical protein